MGSGLDWKTVAVLGPILGLLLVGLAIALKSGVASLSTHQGMERLIGNLSQLLLRVTGYLIGFLAIQRLVGAPFTTW
jgi:hypothetical protein